MPSLLKLVNRTIPLLKFLWKKVIKRKNFSLYSKANYVDLIINNIDNYLIPKKISTNLCPKTKKRVIINPTFIVFKNCIILLFLSTFLWGNALLGQTLEIHQISVGHGDAAVLIIRDTAQLRQNMVAAGVPIPPNRTHMLKVAIDSSVSITGTVLSSLLLDAGNGSKQAAKINSYLLKMGLANLNHLMISHYHQDHIGGIPGIVAAFPPTNNEVYDLGKVKPGPSKFVYKRYKKALRGKNRREKDINSIIDFYNALLPNKKIRLTCISAKGYVIGEDKNNDLVPTYRVKKGITQNDFGLAWILQYGAFRYYTGGDLGSFYEGNYIDVESPMVDSLQNKDTAKFTDSASNTDLNPGHVCAFKVSHHGSAYSSNSFVLSVLQSKVAVISCGDSHGHPNEEVIEELERDSTLTWDFSTWSTKYGGMRNNTIINYYLTSLLQGLPYPNQNNIMNATSTGIVGGNIAIIVNDENIEKESKYSVFWDGEMPGGLVSYIMIPARAAGINNYQCHKVKNNNINNLKYIQN